MIFIAVFFFSPLSFMGDSHEQEHYEWILSTHGRYCGCFGRFGLEWFVMSGEIVEQGGALKSVKKPLS